MVGWAGTVAVGVAHGREKEPQITARCLVLQPACGVGLDRDGEGCERSRLEWRGSGICLDTC